MASVCLSYVCLDRHAWLSMTSRVMLGSDSSRHLRGVQGIGVREDPFSQRYEGNSNFAEYISWRNKRYPPPRSEPNPVNVDCSSSSSSSTMHSNTIYHNLVSREGTESQQEGTARAPIDGFSPCSRPLRAQKLGYFAILMMPCPSPKTEKEPSLHSLYPVSWGHQDRSDRRPT